jgi:hypothetical protein
MASCPHCKMRFRDEMLKEELIGPPGVFKWKQLAVVCPNCDAILSITPARESTRPVND